MMNVYIWGTGIIADKCIKDLKPDINVLGFVESHPKPGKKYRGCSVLSGEEVLKKQFDYIIIASSYYDEIIEEFFKNEKRMILYPYDVVSDNNRIRFKRKCSNPCKPFLSDDKMEAIDECRKYSPFISVEYEGLKFIFDRREHLMPSEMIFDGEVYSHDEMVFFDRFIQKDQGYFLDIGANVGTTTVYFSKKLRPGLSYYAFEPLGLNCRYLKLNLVANDCDNATVVNSGISDEDKKIEMNVVEGSFGSSGVVDERDVGAIVETCDFQKLDSFMLKNNLSAENTSAIWIDVQDHEYEVINGGLDTFKKSACPVFMEFNYKAYEAKGTYDDFVSVLSSVYNYFICFEQYEKGRAEKRNIKELINLKNEFSDRMYFCNILLLKR